MSTKKEKCNGTKAEWLLEFENMVKDNSFVTPSSHLNVLAIQDFISQAITTAVAKRELEIAEEVEKKSFRGFAPYEQDYLIKKEDVLSILKH